MVLDMAGYFLPHIINDTIIRCYFSWKRDTDVKIDSINIPHVTVADDLAVLAREYCDMQVILWNVENNTDRGTV